MSQPTKRCKLCNATKTYRWYGTLCSACYQRDGKPRIREPYNYDLDVFFREDDISYYLLGTFITDGCISRGKNGVPYSATLASKDLDWLKAIRNLVCKKLPIRHDYKDNPNFGSIILSSKQLANWFIDHGCTPRKSLTVKFPKVPSKYLPDFLRGCIDGDGNVGFYTSQRKTRKKGKLEYKFQITLYGGSLEFQQGYRQVLTTLGVSYSSRKRKGKTTKLKNGKTINSKNWCYETAVAGADTIKLISWLYYPGHRLSMPRKAKEVKRMLAMYSKLPHDRPRGERMGNAKMTVKKVRRARKLFATGKWRCCDLAAKFHIDGSQMSRILNNQFWKEVA